MTKMQKLNTPTEYRQQLRKRILEVASHEFRSKGIKAVKMDDIANSLSISKRTLYEIYENKEQLLMETVKEECNKFDACMQAFSQGGNHHVIEVLTEFYRLQMKSLAVVTPVYFVELEKYPQILAWLTRNREERHRNAIQFFKVGIEEGYFRSNVNYELIIKGSSGMMDYIMENRLYNSYSMQEILRNVVLLYIRGFCTLKGIEELDKRDI